MATTGIGGGHHLYLSQQSLPLKKENKLSRLLAKEEDGCKESSFRAYYEGSGVAVPFIWESTPGTPKHSLFSDSYYNNMPPLTPPPSCHSKQVVVMMTNNKSSSPYLLQNQTSKNRFLRGIFGRHRNVSPLSWTTSSSSISSFSSSSYDDSSSHSTPKSFTASSSKSQNKKTNSMLHRRWSSLSSSNRPRSPLHVSEEDDEEHTGATPGSPSSTLCFAVGRKNGSNTTTSKSQQGFRGCLQWRI